MKNFVYLQRQSKTNAGVLSAMQSVAGFIFAQGVAYMPAASQPRNTSVMGVLSAFEWIDIGKWPPLFLCHKVSNSNTL